MADVSGKERHVLCRKRYILLFIMGILFLFQVVGSILNLSNAGYFHGNPIHQNELEKDLLHLNYLNDICLNEFDSIIPWTYNSPILDTSQIFNKNTPLADLMAELSKCPEIDVMLPNHLHGHGYCEDAMVYVKYLKTRSLPMWVFDIQFNIDGEHPKTYFDLCPKTAILLLNHYWDDIHLKPTLPANKKLILMPNTEMYELKAEHYQRVDYVLAKTKDAFNRLIKWYKKEGNPRHTIVRYTQHTSSDPSSVARFVSKTRNDFGKIKKKDFNNLKIFHANGASIHKNTPKVLECWRDRPNFPPIHIFSKDEGIDSFFNGSPPSNVIFHLGKDLSTAEYGRHLAEASVILCPSAMEGFGHYINQARAAGALVVTTNGTPMNEFVNESSGVLIDATIREQHGIVLLGNDTEWNVDSKDICFSIEKILAMSSNERKYKAEEGKKKYYQQLLFFKNQMNQLRKEFT